MMEGSSWNTAGSRWTERLEALGSRITWSSLTLTSVIHELCAIISQPDPSYLVQNTKRNCYPLTGLLPKTFADQTFFSYSCRKCVCVCPPLSNLPSHSHTRAYICFRVSTALDRGGTAQAHMSSTAMILYVRGWFQSQAAMSRGLALLQGAWQ